MKPISIDDQIRCVERELAMRRNVYPRQIANGRMKPDAAEYELAALEAVRRTLRTLATIFAEVSDAEPVFSEIPEIQILK